jgi:DNA polymerase sigma
MPTEGIPASLLEALDQELLQFESFVRLTPVEVQARQRVISVVQSTATQKYSTAQIQPFG